MTTFWKHVARNVVNLDKRHQPPQRPPLRPFAHSVVPPERRSRLADDDDGNADVLPWRLMAPTSTLVH